MQVLEVNQKEGLVLVHFMVQHQTGLYRWDTSKDDTSWEDMEYFTHNSRKVSIELNALRSTQRWQLFDVTMQDC